MDFKTQIANKIERIIYDPDFENKCRVVNFMGVLISDVKTDEKVLYLRTNAWQCCVVEFPDGQTVEFYSDNNERMKKAYNFLSSIAKKQAQQREQEELNKKNMEEKKKQSAVLSYLDSMIK